MKFIIQVLEGNIIQVLEGKISAKYFPLSDENDLVTIKNRSNSKFTSVSTLFAIYSICEKMRENSFLGNELSTIITINKFIIFNNPSATISNFLNLIFDTEVLLCWYKRSK